MKSMSLLVAMTAGVIVLIDFFFANPIVGALGTAFKEWAVLLTAFALLLGLANLLRVHLTRIARRDEAGVSYSVVMLAVATGVLVSGLIFGLADGPLPWLFDHVYLPLQSSLFALTAFFLATAAYRALRARSIETFLMLVAAGIVFLGQTPWLSGWTIAKDWLLRVPSEAGVRGILLGVALGTLATGVRLLLGIDRPYSDS
jgi:hypothetical protein